jgi:D-arginine dehydrogenase
LSAADALAMVPVLRPGAVALAVHEDGVLDMDVNAMHQGFLRGLRSQGGSLVLDSRIGRIARAGDAWVVESESGRWQAPVLVNAAGAWADPVAALAGLAPIGLEPRRRTVVLLPSPALSGVERWPAVGIVGADKYFKPESGRLMASPGDAEPVEPQDVQPDEIDIARVMDWLGAFTTLSTARIERRWAGLRTFASDASPVVGEDPAAPGFFWLAGQGGYGIMMAESLGRLAAALVLERDMPDDLARLGLELASVLPDRFRG